MCVTPYCMHNIGIAGLNVIAIVIVVLFVHVNAVVFVSVSVFDLFCEHVEYLWKAKTEFA